MVMVKHMFCTCANLAHEITLNDPPHVICGPSYDHIRIGERICTKYVHTHILHMFWGAGKCVCVFFLCVCVCCPFEVGRGFCFGDHM